ncbi:polyphosphate kinase 2 family protein [Luteolibacter arcticus]|uniref:Polyphosphate kinase 2 family protein n=1 Tax=Luteolibacter arcticus TaxID=1581411 RepID=A0ABT3GMN0_9BACT|nr:polyphosphate kinase 2 family protein [Luteolibacter arcticus]MCW1924725.1 polyphosphate kinase 2 family protein [Luteolibacter arcticus]
MKYNLNPDRKIKIEVGDKGTMEFKLCDILVPPETKVSLKKDYDPDFTGGFEDKAGALERVASNVQRLSELQEKLYAQDVYGILVIFQAIDAAGKDGAIRHVMSGVNPQGCHVTSFKSPSSEELDHDYLWRATKALPARGMIGIFNRSYYEEVLAVKVHPEFLVKQNLPGKPGGKGFWERRYKEINRFEKYLTSNGIIPIKFFLNLSRKEQKKRFLARIDEPKKNWKFSVADFKERGQWDDYQQAFEDMLNHTSTDHAPWFVIPSDNKWFARLAISEAICTVLEGLKLKFPDIGDERRAELLRIREELVND